MNQNSSIDTTPFTPTEAKARKAKIKQCMTDLTDQGNRLGELLYEFLARNGPEALGIDRAELRRKLAKTSGVHRSTVYRLYDWAVMELSLGLTHGQLKEYPTRTLKTKVRDDAWRRVLARARKDTGYYRKITAKDILAAAEKLHCLKQAPARQTDADRGKRPPDVDKHPKMPRKTKYGVAEAEDGGRADGDQPSTSAASYAEASAAEDPVEAFQSSWDQWKKSLQKSLEQLLNQARQMFKAADALGPEERRQVWRMLSRELSRLDKPTS